MPTWSHTIELDSTDITAETVLDSVLVEEAERSSFLLDVTWRPSGGQQTGLALQTIELTVNMGAGAVTLFFGKVIRAAWDERAQSYRLRGSSRIQEHFRALGSESAVQSALTGAYTSEDFLGEPPEDLWEYAEQLMETIPKDVHIDRAGSLNLIDWEAKGTADHTLTASDVDDQADVQWIEADADIKTNQVILELGYSVMRRKVRDHTISWHYLDEGDTNSFCGWIQGSDGAYWSPPTLDQAQDVGDAGSWSTPGGVSAEQIPLDEPDLCFAGMIPLEWWFERDSHPLTSFSAVGYQAFESEIQETHTITLNADGAQTLYGDTVTVRRQAALVVEPEDDWPPEAVSSGTLESPSTDTVGDDYVDEEDAAARTSLFATAYNWGKTRLLDGQRQDSRVVRTILRPDIELEDTVRINLFGLDTTGKVRRLRHTLAPLRTEVTIAVSRGGGTDDAWSVPARPASNDPETYWETYHGGGWTYPTPSASHSVPTYVGSRTTSADESTFNADEEGWFTNAWNYPGFSGDEDKIYTEVLRVHWPEREAEATGGMEFSVSLAYEVETPSDPLVIA